MPDITLCVNKECPISSRCYRFTAPAKDDGSQSFAIFQPFHVEGTNVVKCDNFLPLQR